MGPTEELIDDIFREKVLRARQTAPDENLLDGPRLFDMECRIMTDNIRNEHPEADDQQVQAILAEQIAVLRPLERPSEITLLP